MTEENKESVFKSDSEVALSDSPNSLTLTLTEGKETYKSYISLPGSESEVISIPDTSEGIYKSYISLPTCESEVLISIGDTDYLNTIKLPEAKEEIKRLTGILSKHNEKESQQNLAYKGKDNECDKLKKDNELKESTITDLQKKNDKLKTQNFTYKEKDNECDKLKKDNELKESTITDLQKKNELKESTITDLQKKNDQLKTQQDFERERHEKHEKDVKQNGGSVNSVQAKKLSPWDMKGRIIEMEVLMKDQNTLNTNILKRIQQLEGQKQWLDQQNHGSSRDREELATQTQINLEKALEKALEGGRLKISELEKTISEHLATIEDMKGKLREDESIRRKLHNTIQELKGNIRVFCRVRPLLEAERKCKNDKIQHIHFCDEKTLKLENTPQNKKDCKTFVFDRVFNPESTQAEVFEEISQLVQSSLDGYNVCIFAYGPTNSGKTFTMEGPEEITSETEGMTPRAMRQVFETATKLADKGWQYKFKASFLEIYNESIRDLLTPDDIKKVKHEVRMVDGNKNDTYVTNLTIKSVTSAEKVNELLLQASKKRHVAETKCNKKSSRSHSVFRLKIEGENMHTGDKCTGLLNLIDLAGLERLNDSGSEGDTLKETQHINASLSNLDKVIMDRAKKKSHIPYRNSKLTHVLQNSLGDNSKTLMFVNLSPKEECYDQTLISLKFATKVNKCSIGTARQK